MGHRQTVPQVTGHRCYMSELGKDDGRCDRPALYLATLNWSAQRWYLCEDHAQEERSWGDVISIESLPRR